MSFNFAVVTFVQAGLTHTYCSAANMSRHSVDYNHNYNHVTVSPESQNTLKKMMTNVKYVRIISALRLGTSN